MHWRSSLTKIFIFTSFLQVPELAGFWLLTVLLQFPLQGFLFLNEDLILLPMERAANFLMVLMIVVELVAGFIALRRITRHQAKKFHLHQLSSNMILSTQQVSMDPKKDI